MACPYSLSETGGVQEQTLGLARSLRTRGHVVTVVAPHDDYQPGTFLTGDGREVSPKYSMSEGASLRPGSFEGDGTFCIGASTRVRSNGSVAPLALSLATVWRVLHSLRHRSPDVIHLHEPLAPMFNYGFLISASAPIVGTFHRSGRSAWQRALMPAATWATQRLAARCAVSADAAHLVSGNDVNVLFNGVETERFTQATPWPTEEPTVMFLARHEKRKGLELLLRAFAGTPDPAVLWIAGDGPETLRLKQMFPASPRIQWLGVLSESEVAQRLRGAHVLCAPSLFGESFGVVLLEAMAAGCSIVASALDGYRMAAQGHAQLFPVGDQQAMTNALAIALSEARLGALERSDALIRASTYAEGLSFTHLAERYESVYKRVCTPQRSGPTSHRSRQISGPPAARPAGVWPGRRFPYGSATHLMRNR
jgi:phosphatidylinositol alpha-mannosyltransferase